MKKEQQFDAVSPIWNFIISIVLVLAALTIVLPVLLVVVISFSSGDSIAANGYTFFPAQWTTMAYETMMKSGTQIRNSYMVTIAHTALGTLMSLVLMSMYAFAIAQKSFGAKKFYTFFLFFTMLFSGGLVPSYIVNVRYLNLYDTFWILMLPSLVTAFNVIILRTFITTTIPDSMYEAAKIDGANDFQIYIRIVMPLFKAGIATVALFNVVSRWNDWFTGMLYIEKPKLIPLQTMLTSIQKNIDFIKNNSELMGTQEGQEMLRNLPTESARMAITIIATVPILFAYPFFQRYFISGLTIGSVKG